MSAETEASLEGTQPSSSGSCVQAGIIFLPSVAKSRRTLGSDAYVTEQERTTWFKIKNRHYSQMGGRERIV